MQVFYYSGSGNSYWAAREIAAHFHAELRSIAEENRRGGAVISDRVVGIVCPTYLDDLPIAVKRCLRRALLLSEISYAFLIMTSSQGKNKKGFLTAAALLRAKGTALSYAADLQMPGNYLASTPEQDEECLAAAPEILKTICRDIEHARANYKEDRPGRVKGRFDRPPLSYRLMSHMTVTEDCNGCGLCARICPAGNISIEDGEAVHGKACECCFACIHWCPRDAVVKRLPPNFRPYRHPGVTAAELFHLDGKK